MARKVPHIGIILGSTRQGRFSERPARWIHALASGRPDLTSEMIDLRDHPMPFFEEPVPPAWGAPQHDDAKTWAATIARLDGVIVVTPEYNHGPSAVMKNALDYAYEEFGRKPIAFVGYGSVGAARAVEQLRLIAIEMQMAPLRNAVHVGPVEMMALLRQEKAFADFPHLEDAATTMLDDVAWWATVLRDARVGQSPETEPAL